MTRYYPSQVVLRDPSLPHQIVIGYMPHNLQQLYVSCNCLLGPRPKQGGQAAYRPLASGVLLAAEDALAIWRQHMKEVAA